MNNIFHTTKIYTVLSSKSKTPQDLKLLGNFTTKAHKLTQTTKEAQQSSKLSKLYKGFSLYSKPYRESNLKNQTKASENAAQETPSNTSTTTYQQHSSNNKPARSTAALQSKVLKQNKQSSAIRFTQQHSRTTQQHIKNNNPPEAQQHSKQLLYQNTSRNTPIISKKNINITSFKLARAFPHNSRTNLPTFILQSLLFRARLRAKLDIIPLFP
jgi:hypothetical protein